MIKRYTFVLILLYCAVVCASRVQGQDKMADSVQLGQIMANAANLFNKAIADQSRLYNGPADIPYLFKSKTNANFKDTTAFINGTVKYDGIIYNNVPLKYDLNRDLLISNINGVLIYDLISEKLAEFDLLDHHFIRLEPDSLNKQMDVGFYDELYQKDLWLLARRAKDIQQDATNPAERIFSNRLDYYLKKRDKYYNVNSQGKFFNVLKDKEKELKQYLKDNKIRFKDNPEYAMTVLAAYYDHLTN